MPIRLEYIVSNSKGDELKRFDSKIEAEAYDSVICAAEDISVLIQPLQKRLALTDDQIDAISEHLAFQADDVKQALKQIKKPKPSIQATTRTENETTVNKAPQRKSGKKKQ